MPSSSRRILLRTSSHASFLARSAAGEGTFSPTSSASPSKRGVATSSGRYQCPHLVRSALNHAFASATKLSGSLSLNARHSIAIVVALSLVLALAWAMASSSSPLQPTGERKSSGSRHGLDDSMAVGGLEAPVARASPVEEREGGRHGRADGSKRSPHERGKERSLEKRDSVKFGRGIGRKKGVGNDAGAADGGVGRRNGGKRLGGGGGEEGEGRRKELVSRVAFGSCTARKRWPQPIWEEAVIPSDPHAWIWLGDIAYVDWPEVDCVQQPQHPQCNCTRDWLHSNRWSCLAGDMAHARAKMEEQLRHPDYVKFLEHMCPGYGELAASASAEEWPPVPELSKCLRPILGTWDDHDYNWQDGNTRLPSKEAQKQLFLDAFGEPASSPRRAPGRGLYTKHTLNEGVRGREIDVLLLDERFYRDPKPCSMRRGLCAHVAIPDAKKDKHVWCLDFLKGGPSGEGSCCKKDERIYEGWCREARNQSESATWRRRCDPTDLRFGLGFTAEREVQSRHVLAGGGRDRNVRKPDRSTSRRGTEEVTSVLQEDKESEMCEMLGSQQRQWLAEELENSPAPLKLLVSGSPLFNNPKPFICSKALKKRREVLCSCVDDFDCYRPAQVVMLHAATRARGCVLVLTGDFHFSDIKVLRPGQQPYSDDYMSADLARPIYQAMASGLTTETARNATCQGFHEDKLGLRSGGPCNFITGPAFGLIQVDWEADEPMVRVQIRSLVPGQYIEESLSLKTCT